MKLTKKMQKKRKKYEGKRARKKKKGKTKIRKRVSRRKIKCRPKMSPKLLLPAALLALSSVAVAGLSVPKRALGFVYGGAVQNTSVEVAAYLDPTCPDSQAVYPTLLNVGQHYTPKQVKFRMYLFPLPYHRNSHTIAKAAHVLNAYKDSKANEDTVFQWISKVFENIDSLTTSATTKQTDVQVLARLTKLATGLTGISESDFTSGVANRDVDLRTRLEWKYGCTRGVYGTPMFTVNDVFVDASGWTFADWTAFLDKLL